MSFYAEGYTPNPTYGGFYYAEDDHQQYLGRGTGVACPIGVGNHSLRGER